MTSTETTYDKSKLSTKLAYLNGKTYTVDSKGNKTEGPLPDPERLGAMKLLSNIIDLVDRANKYSRPYWKIELNQRWYIEVKIECEDYETDRGLRDYDQGLRIEGYYKGERETSFFVHFLDLVDNCPLDKLNDLVTTLQAKQHVNEQNG